MAKAKPASTTKQVKKIQTLHLSAKVRKLLWRHRAETGQTASFAVEALILKHLKSR